MLYFLLQVSFLVDEGVSPVLLQLLSCALCGSKVLATSSSSSSSSSGGGGGGSGGGGGPPGGSQPSQTKSSSKKSKKEDKEKDKDGEDETPPPHWRDGIVARGVWLPAVKGPGFDSLDFLELLTTQ